MPNQENTCLAFDSHLNEPLRLSVVLESKNMQKQHIMSSHHDLKGKTQACMRAHTHTPGKGKKRHMSLVCAGRVPDGGFRDLLHLVPVERKFKGFPALL